VFAGAGTGGTVTISGALGGSTASSGLAKSGAGTLTLSGNANTYQGTTTGSGGSLVLSKVSGQIAVPGFFRIENAAVLFGTNNGSPFFDNQIASTAAVTMSGSTAVFNGTGWGGNAGAGATFWVSQTLASFTVTGGVVNATNFESATRLTIPDHTHRPRRAELLSKS
jgi:autotransporter-associated beta strand protein